MYKIVCKKELNSAVTYMEIEAPFVARKAKAGQFIIFRVDDKSERVPLTIAGYDREKGTVAIIFQKVGLSTELLGSMNEGDYIQDFVGPLGKPTDVEGKKRVCVVGGGVGCAIAYPSAKAFKEAGVETDVIVGFRNQGHRHPRGRVQVCVRQPVPHDRRRLLWRKGLCHRQAPAAAGIR